MGVTELSDAQKKQLKEQQEVRPLKTGNSVGVEHPFLSLAAAVMDVFVCSLGLCVSGHSVSKEASRKMVPLSVHATPEGLHEPAAGLRLQDLLGSPCGLCLAAAFYHTGVLVLNGVVFVSLP